MSQILQRCAGVTFVLLLGLASISASAKTQEVRVNPPPESAESPKDHSDGIRSWLEPALVQSDTENASKPHIRIKRQAENVYVVSITSKGKTSERHGLLRLNWDQRQHANLTVVVSRDHYYVSAVDGFSELKAPLGQWQPVEEGVPDIYSGRLPSVGTAMPVAR